MTLLRTLAFWTGVALLVALGILGFWSALGSLDSISTAGQRVAIVTQFGYALTAFLAAAALVARHPWARRLLWLWAALTTVTGGLAPVVWGEARPGAGLAAAAASAAIAGLVARLATLRTTTSQPQ
jgi:hypothetical protein